jgi:uncharacterized protein
MTISTHLGAGAADQLRTFLASPDRPQDTLSYNELKGFLFAITCSPEMIPPSDWMPLVFADEDANFRSLDEAGHINQAIMALYNRINQEVVEETVKLPASCQPAETLFDNFSENAPLGEWARGFLHGHSYLEDIWNEYVPEELDEEIGSCLMILSFFADRGLAEAYYEEVFSGEASFDELAQEALEIFEEAMASYAHIGRSILEALEEQGEDECEFAEGVALSAEDPCPCDSGKHFKHCCGGNKTVH